MYEVGQQEAGRDAALGHAGTTGHDRCGPALAKLWLADVMLATAFGAIALTSLKQGAKYGSHAKTHGA